CSGTPRARVFACVGNPSRPARSANPVSRVPPAGAINAFFAGGLNGPVSLAFDAAGDLFVANRASGTISKLLPAFSNVDSYAGNVPTTYASGFRAPQSLTWDPAGKLYVADSGAGVVSKVARPRTNASAAVAIAGLDAPAALALDPAGNRYVYDAADNVVRKVTSTGAVSTFVANPGFLTGMACD